MLASSRLTSQISEGRGHAGARKLIPMPPKISRAPGRPTLIGVRQSTIGRIVVLVIPGARRLWRAQTNPYAAQNLVRARLAAHADTPLSALLTHFWTLPGSLCFTVRNSKPTPNSDPSVSIGVHLWRKQA